MTELRPESYLANVEPIKRCKTPTVVHIQDRHFFQQDFCLS